MTLLLDCFIYFKNNYNYKINMFRLMITIVLSLALNNVWADCDITSKFNINVNTVNIKYDYNKTSAQIKKIPNIKTNNESQYLLGAYIPILSIGINYQSMRENSFGKTCNKVVSMNVTLNLESTVFISKEIQPFSCTLNRTLQHENTHFSFEKDALAIGIDYLKKNLEPVFSQKIYSSENEYNQYIKGQLEILQKNTLNTIENYAVKRHNTIDNPDNYKRESQLCSSNEHEMISKSILSFIS